MSAPEMVAVLRELEAYGYVVQVETDEAIESALIELALADEEGE